MTDFRRMQAKPVARGFTLPTLLALLTLASLATLLALRNQWVDAQMLNAHADQLRTQLHAQAILPLAVQNIVDPTRATAGDITQTHVFFPASLADYDTLRSRLGTDLCRAGICAPTSPLGASTQASFWKTQNHSATPVTTAESPHAENVAWYWVEVFPRDNTTLFVYRITVLTIGLLPSSSTVLQAIWTRSATTATTGQWHSMRVLRD